MNRLQRWLVRKQVERAMREMNIPFGKNEDVLKKVKDQIEKKQAEMREKKKDEFDDLLLELPYEAYEVLATCNTCAQTDIIGASPDMFEALEVAKANNRLHVDEKHVPHVYRAAVVKISRELVFSPEDVEQEKRKDN